MESLEVHGEIEPLVASLIISGSRFRRDLDAIHSLENDKWLPLCSPSTRACGLHEVLYSQTTLDLIVPLA